MAEVLPLLSLVQPAARPSREYIFLCKEHHRSQSLVNLSSECLFIYILTHHIINICILYVVHAQPNDRERLNSELLLVFKNIFTYSMELFLCFTESLD